jgi:hypothetical protein
MIKANRIIAQNPLKHVVSRDSLAEREGFEDFSKSGNVEKSRKE